MRQILTSVRLQKRTRWTTRSIYHVPEFVYVPEFFISVEGSLPFVIEQFWQFQIELLQFCLFHYSG